MRTIDRGAGESTDRLGRKRDEEIVTTRRTREGGRNERVVSGASSRTSPNIRLSFHDSGD
jgi:hypothetical protein